MMPELDDIITWADRAIGAAVTDRTVLTGGLTSTMHALTDDTGREWVLRLMTEEPWRTHGEGLTRREHDAQVDLADTAVPAPISVAFDAEGTVVGVPAHLMTRLPGEPIAAPGADEVSAMASMLALIHDVEPARSFRPYQSWAPPAKRVVPAWTKHPRSWQSAFALLEQDPPDHDPVLLQRDFSHRNLLWKDGAITGIVDWVETSSGPAWLDVAHAATTLAISSGPDHAESLLRRYEALTARRPEPYWLVMDAVGFLPFPGREPLFGSPAELAGLDAWLDRAVRGFDTGTEGGAR